MTYLIVKTLFSCKHFQLFTYFYFKVFWLIFPSVCWLERKVGCHSFMFLSLKIFCSIVITVHQSASLDKLSLKKPAHLIKHHCPGFFNRDLCHKLMFFSNKVIQLLWKFYKMYFRKWNTHKQVNYIKYNLFSHIKLITATWEDEEWNIWKGGRIAVFFICLFQIKKIL